MTTTTRLLPVQRAMVTASNGAEAGRLENLVRIRPLLPLGLSLLALAVSVYGLLVRPSEFTAMEGELVQAEPRNPVPTLRTPMSATQRERIQLEARVKHLETTLALVRSATLEPPRPHEAPHADVVLGGQRSLDCEEAAQAEAVLAAFLTALGPNVVQARSPGRATVGTAELLWRSEGTVFEAVARPVSPSSGPQFSMAVASAVKLWFELNGLDSSYRGRSSVRLPFTSWKHTVAAVEEEFANRRLPLTQSDVLDSAYSFVSGSSAEPDWIIWIEIMGEADVSISVIHYSRPFDVDGERSLLRAILNRGLARRSEEDGK